MEKEAAPEKRQRRAAALSVLSSLCSVASVAFCVHLSLLTAGIKHRVVDLESARGEHSLIRTPGYSVEDLNSLVQQRLEELLSQVS